MEHDPLLPELEAFLVKGVFDGELVAFTDGQPDFVALCDRMLLRSDLRVPIAYIVFDVLSLESRTTMRKPYWRRREILESLDLVGPHLESHAVIRGRRRSLERR